jgi:CubicO group peptidase (beta-lactamase class C family)
MKRNLLYAVATVLAAVGQASAQTSPAAPATPAARESLPADSPLVRVQAAVDAWFLRAKPPGATVAFLTEDGRAGAVAVGVSRKDPATPMKPTDRMMSGSIGKTWVSAVMLQLVEEGKADLDAPLSTWLGDRVWFSRIPNHKDITLRQLMNHTSGIREHVTAPDFIAALKEHPDKTWTPEELAAFCLDKDPLFPAARAGATPTPTTSSSAWSSRSHRPHLPPGTPRPHPHTPRLR